MYLLAFCRPVEIDCEWKGYLIMGFSPRKDPRASCPISGMRNDAYEIPLETLSQEEQKEEQRILSEETQDLFKRIGVMPLGVGTASLANSTESA